MKLILTNLFIFLFTFNTVLSQEYISAVWVKNSKTAYNECNIILSFLCTMTQDVKSDINSAVINSYLSIYDKNNKLIEKFRVKKIEYSNGRCWLTPQPIRKYTTYFTTDRCVAR